MIRLLLLYPKMNYEAWSFFTGINPYFCGKVYGVSIGFLGFGVSIEVIIK